MADRILRETEVAQTTGLARTTRYRLEREGAFPARREIAPGRVGWLESEILAWLRATRVRQFGGRVA